MARQRMQIARTDAEINQVVNTLALALGATRPEDATLKALFAVLVHLNRPEMSEREVCASTGASFGNFKRWRRRVLNAQLDFRKICVGRSLIARAILSFSLLRSGP